MSCGLSDPACILCLRSHFQLSSAVDPLPATMDAATIAAAALAIVVDESREAAMRELLLERERLAMTVADRDS